MARDLMRFSTFGTGIISFRVFWATFCSSDLGVSPLRTTLCTRLLREQQQLGHVELQSLHIGLQALSTSVATTMVYGNANGLGKLPWNLGLLQLIQGETFAQSNLHVVALRWRMHQRTKQSSRRTWKDLGRLLLASVGATLLAAGLVQPGAHENPVLPTSLASVDLPEVHIGDDVVASVTHGNRPTDFSPLARLRLILEQDARWPKWQRSELPSFPPNKIAIPH